MILLIGVLVMGLLSAPGEQMEHYPYTEPSKMCIIGLLCMVCLCRRVSISQNGITIHYLFWIPRRIPWERVREIEFLHRGSPQNKIIVFALDSCPTFNQSHCKHLDIFLTRYWHKTISISYSFYSAKQRKQLWDTIEQYQKITNANQG